MRLFCVQDNSAEARLARKKERALARESRSNAAAPAPMAKKPAHAMPRAAPKQDKAAEENINSKPIAIALRDAHVQETTIHPPSSSSSSSASSAGALVLTSAESCVHCEEHPINLVCDTCGFLCQKCSTHIHELKKNQSHKLQPYVQASGPSSLLVASSCFPYIVRTRTLNILNMLC